jgi:hypothetical protein
MIMPYHHRIWRKERGHSSDEQRRIVGMEKCNLMSLDKGNQAAKSTDLEFPLASKS